MNQTATQGNNRTGITVNEELAEEMTAGVAEFPPSSVGPPIGADVVRIEYAREAEGRGLGSVPPPVGFLGKTKATVEKVVGHDPTVFMDKLSERIAFERTGTRLYEALISKLEADGGFEGGPTREELLEHLNEEHGHFTMLVELMRDMGGDPTAMTPSADVSATASMGVLKVITDARTTLLQGLEAMLIAELTDREGWQALCDLARQNDKEDLVKRFEEAEATEARHIYAVRTWVGAGQGRAMPAAAE